MTPAWKEYTSAEWGAICGVSEDLICKETGGFIFNSNGICVNPHVLGLRSGSWRIGIRTARTPEGRWVGGEDISFISAGHSYGCSGHDPDHYPDEDFCRIAKLRNAALFVECNSNPERSSCPIPGNVARAALRMLSEKITQLEPRKTPIYTQLTLF